MKNLLKKAATVFAVLTVSFTAMGSVNANAAIYDNYSEKIQNLSDFTAIPEIVQYFDNDFENSEYSCISNVWVKSIDKYMSERILELCRKDFLNVQIDSDVSVEDIGDELYENFGGQNVKISGYDRNQYQDYLLISLTFTDSDHDGNIELSEEITKFLESRYHVTESTGNFDSTAFLKETVYWNLIRPSNLYDTYKLTEEEITQLNDYLTGVNAYFDTDTQRMILPEDMTEIEKCELDSELNKTFNLKFNTYGLADIESDNGETIDFLSVSELKGDANLDGRVSISDSVAIIQYLANFEKYSLSPQGKINADCDGSDGITGLDAAYIQLFEAAQS